MTEAMRQAALIQQLCVDQPSELSLERGGNGEGLERCGQLVSIVALPQEAGLEDHFRDLFHVERHPVGAHQHVLQDLRRQRLVAGNTQDHLLGGMARQARERDLRCVRPRWRSKVGSRGEQHTDRHRRGLVDEHREKLQRRGVDPVKILDSKKQRALRGE